MKKLQEQLDESIKDLTADLILRSKLLRRMVFESIIFSVLVGPFIGFLAARYFGATNETILIIAVVVGFVLAIISAYLTTNITHAAVKDGVERAMRYQKRVQQSEMDLRGFLGYVLSSADAVYLRDLLGDNMYRWRPTHIIICLAAFSVAEDLITVIRRAASVIVCGLAGVVIAGPAGLVAGLVVGGVIGVIAGKKNNTFLGRAISAAFLLLKRIFLFNLFAGGE